MSEYLKDGVFEVFEILRVKIWKKMEDVYSAFLHSFNVNDAVWISEETH